MVSFFELPANLTAEKFLTKLGDKVEVSLSSRQYILKTFYDSFDWRLYRQGLTCELNRSRQSSSLLLTDRKNGSVVASAIMFDIPPFSHQFNPGKVRQILDPILDVRALIALCTLECDAYHINVVNADQKIVLRLFLEEFQLINNRLTLLPVKGYDKPVNQITELVTNSMGLMPIDKPVLLEALRLQGRQPKDYSSKLDIRLKPEMPADAAIKRVFNHLLKTIRLNEQGLLADTDSEFLHDFRVAVRRTRVGLNQAKHILPDDIIAKYQDFFSWLGKITGETRDLDVYLLNFDQYKKKLPSVIRQNINPLYNFLVLKKHKAHRQLTKKLRSDKYLTLLNEWETYLLYQQATPPTEKDAPLAIKEVADYKIWKFYKKVVKAGGKIDAESQPENLHKLRKTCKKLRYLMEFFQRLYPERPMEKQIKTLKRLQDVLGNYQDYSVQQAHLKQYSEEMQNINTPGKTFLAMGILIQDFEDRKLKIRDQFDTQFAVFKNPENYRAFRELFAPGHLNSEHNF